MKLAGISVKEKKSERYDEKSRLWPGFFYYEVDLFNEKKCKSKVTFRGCIGGASLNCINFVIPMNPCPCGYYPDRNRCRCTEPQIRRYMGRVSGPILDRIDLCVELQAVDIASLRNCNKNENSERIRERVVRARELQKERFQGTKYQFNGEIEAADMEKFCVLGEKEQQYMEQLYRSLDLSARAYHRILKVARTIADLAEAEEIKVEHLLEAAFYRPAQEYWQ